MGGIMSTTAVNASKAAQIEALLAVQVVARVAQV